MTQSVNYCETCRWWKDRRPVLAHGFEGVCVLIWHESEEGEYIRKADTCRCDHDFGCVLWEEKEGA